jgi:urea transporter
MGRTQCGEAAPFICGNKRLEDVLSDGDRLGGVSRALFIALVAVAVVLLVVGLVVASTALALVGLFGAVVVVAVQALIAGGDWIQDASRRRFRDHER